MRLIDADAFIRFLAEQNVKETGAFTKGVNKALNIAISALKNPQITPTVDAVHVIRCRDCIHRWGDEYPMCMLHTEPCANARGYKGEAVCVDMDGFCSYGKERAKPINSAPLNQEERWLKTV